MKITERHKSITTVTLTFRDFMITFSCIREVWRKLAEGDAQSLIGVSRKYLDNLLTYYQGMRDHGFSKIPSPSPTLRVYRISDQESYVGMGKEDIDIFIKCMTEALKLVPDWEFHVLIGAYKDEVRILLEDFRKLL